MKKFFIVALAAIGMVACMNEEITELPAGNEISFDNAFIDNATRAELTADNMSEFKVWGYVDVKYDGETTGQIAPLFEGTTVSKTTNGWQYTDGARCWAPAQWHHFEAVAPLTNAVSVNADAANAGKIATISYTVDGDSDLIYAAYDVTAKAAGQDNGAVTFTFNHLLSKVNFTFTNGFTNDDYIIKVKEITMTVPAEGTYTIEGGNWSVPTGSTTLSFADSADEIAANANDGAARAPKFVIPNGSNATYVITFKVDVLYNDVRVNKDVLKTSTVAGVALEKGKAYNFTATIDADALDMENIEFGVETINGWVERTEPVNKTKPANNEIWYTNGSTATATTPHDSNVFGANIVSNLYDTAKECWVITFDGDVTEIGDKAFSNCSGLSSIIIPDSVILIGESAFYNCGGIQSIAIPNSVTSIGDWAFHYCDDLTSVIMGDGVISIGEGAFASCYHLVDITIPNDVTSIGGGAFAACDGFLRITIPESVAEFGWNICHSCTYLIGFYGKFASSDNRCLIVDGVLNSFAASGLTEYIIPDDVTSIGNGAFIFCENLERITIPESVASIGDSAFAYCSNLAKICCKATIPPTGVWGMFHKTVATIYVPTESVDAYKAADGWSNYADSIEGYDFE